MSSSCFVAVVIDMHDLLLPIWPSLLGTVSACLRIIVSFHLPHFLKPDPQHSRS
jgi:hypothetical protein